MTILENVVALIMMILIVGDAWYNVTHPEHSEEGSMDRVTLKPINIHSNQHESI